MNKIQKSISRIAAAITAIMIMYVPADMVLNGHVLGFEYRFLWELGAESVNQFHIFTPNFGLLATQVFGLMSLTLLLVKSFESSNLKK